VRVTFNELAERELNDAAQYYEVERPDLGKAFITEVQRCTQEVVDHPLAGAVVGTVVRRRMCQRFPYALLYAVNDEEIRILAVMHVRRRPGYWVGRR
jgi:toxin ParE1/3/4